MRRSAVLHLAGLLLIVTAGPVASAATVETTIRDNQGNPLPGIRLALEPLAPGPPGQPGGSILGRFGAPIRRGVTGSDGKAVLTDIPVGSYFVNSGRAEDRFLIHPAQNPFLSPSVISRSEAGGSRPRGARLLAGRPRHLPALAERRRRQRGTRSIHGDGNRAAGGAVSGPAGVRRDRAPAGTLGGGDRPPAPGFLLLSLEQDRERLPGSKASIDVTSGSRVIGLIWKYGAPCRVSGRLSWDIGPDLGQDRRDPAEVRSLALRRGRARRQLVREGAGIDGQGRALRAEAARWRLASRGRGRADRVGIPGVRRP